MQITRGLHSTFKRSNVKNQAEFSRWLKVIYFSGRYIQAASYLSEACQINDYPTTYLPTLWQLLGLVVCLHHLTSNWRSRVQAVNSQTMRRSSFFSFTLLGLINLPRGVVILFDTVHTSSPWEISSPSQENNCCHLRQISFRHLLPLTGFSCGVQSARRISALSQTSKKQTTVHTVYVQQNCASAYWNTTPKLQRYLQRCMYLCLNNFMYDNWCLFWLHISCSE